MESLRQFNGDGTKELLAEFLFASIEREAIRRMYAGEDVTHIKDAKDLLDKCFQELDDLYKVKIKVDEYINQAK